MTQRITEIRTGFLLDAIIQSSRYANLLVVKTQLRVMTEVFLRYVYTKKQLLIQFTSQTHILLFRISHTSNQAYPHSDLSPISGHVSVGLTNALISTSVTNLLLQISEKKRK
jgi:hypothetical protein